MSAHTEIDRYLDQLDAQLRGSRRYRRETLAEIKVHLRELDQMESSSFDDVIRRFGEVDEIAAQLNEVRHAARRRRLTRITTELAAVGAAGLVSLTSLSQQLFTHDVTPSTSTPPHPMIVALDPRTGTILSVEPLSGTGAH